MPRGRADSRQEVCEEDELKVGAWERMNAMLLGDRVQRETALV